MEPNGPPLAPPPHGARVAVASCFLLNGLLFATWVSRIPAVRGRLGISHSDLGLALLCMAAGGLMAMPLAGWLATRFGSRRILEASVVLNCAILPLVALAPGLPSLMLVLLGLGITHGGFDMCMNAQAVAVEARYGRPIMSSFHALWSTGALLGAALGAGIAAAGLAPLVHFTAEALPLGVLAAVFLFPRLLKSDLPRPVSEAHSERPRWKLPPRRLIALGAIVFFVMMGEGAMADWSAIYLREFARASEALAAAGYAAFSVAMALGRFSGDYLTTRLGRVPLLRLSGLLATTGLLLALLVPQAPLVLLGLAAVGAGFAAVVPLVFSAADRTPGIGASAALAITTTVGYSGLLIGPPVIGFAAEEFGLRAALSLIVVASATLVVLARFAGEPARRDWPPGLPTAWEERSQTLS